MAGPVPSRVAAAFGTAAVCGTAAAVVLWATSAGIGPARWDRPVLDAAAALRTPAWTTASIAVTEVGNTVAMAVLALVVAAVLWWRGSRPDAVFLAGAWAGAVLLFRGLKVLFDRARPPVADRVVPATSEALPSGHATMAVTVVGALLVLAWEHARPAVRLLLVTAGGGWVVAVGLTRIYLGVHWFTDVLAGWLLGAAWLALATALWAMWRRRTGRWHTAAA